MGEDGTRKEPGQEHAKDSKLGAEPLEADSAEGAELDAAELSGEAVIDLVHR